VNPHNGLRRVQCAAHIVWARSTVEEVVRKTVRRVHGRDIARTKVFEGPVGQTLPLPIVCVGRLSCPIPAVTAETVLHNPSVGFSYVRDVESLVPVAVRCVSGTPPLDFFAGGACGELHHGAGVTTTTKLFRVEMSKVSVP
jgi:hypothetical protein